MWMRILQYQPYYKEHNKLNCRDYEDFDNARNPAEQQRYRDINQDNRRAMQSRRRRQRKPLNIIEQRSRETNRAVQAREYALKNHRDRRAASRNIEKLL